MEENKNVFEDLTPKMKMPESAKAEVLDRLAAAKLMLDFWDLFAPKRVAVNLNILNQTSQIPPAKKIKKK